jgi:hypothetical protein
MKWTFVLLALLLVTGCTPRGRTPDDLPTPLADLNLAATAQVMTQNAPPPRFANGVSVPRLDSGLDDVAHYRARIALDFDGVFADTPRPARGHVDADVSYTELGTLRRVVIRTDGELLATGEASQLEAVRIGGETYLVQDNLCRVTTGTDAASVSDLGAGALIGGVREAVPTGEKQVINGEEVWRYAFLQDALDINAAVQARDGGRITYTGGELWFAPAHEAVIRFYLTLDVENVTVFGSQLPVSGQVIIRYDVSEVGVDPNISVPNGC